MKQIILIFLTVGVLMAVLLAVKQMRNNMTGLSPTSGSNQKDVNSSAPVQGLILSVEQPVNNSVINESQTVVKGKTSPDASVFVNDQELKADSLGKFSTTINLEEGENYILISANDEEGNYAEQEIIVSLETAQ